MEGASRRPVGKAHKARRVADTMSATDSRPGTACLSAVFYRLLGRRAAAGIDDLRRIVIFNITYKSKYNTEEP